MADVRQYHWSTQIQALEYMFTEIVRHKVVHFHGKLKRSISENSVLIFSFYLDMYNVLTIQTLSAIVFQAMQKAEVLSITFVPHERLLLPYFLPISL